MIPGSLPPRCRLVSARETSAGRRGEIRLFPPTMVSLSELAESTDVDTVLSGPRRVAPIIPEVHEREGAVWLTVPGLTEFPAMPGGVS